MTPFAMRGFVGSPLAASGGPFLSLLEDRTVKMLLEMSHLFVMDALLPVLFHRAPRIVIVTDFLDFVW